MNYYIAAMLVVLLCLGACTSEPKIPQDPNKYVFSDLNEVDAINHWRLHGWSEVDENSLIVRTGPKTSYLLILTRPNYDLNMAQGIIVSSTAGSVRARFDSVSTLRKKGLRYPIARIYQLEGKKQRNDIKARILAE
tara:strand:- start:3900 stop:4307 length:408 start_codon:yes stop_codon:yes gene_type:complete